MKMTKHSLTFILGMLTLAAGTFFSCAIENDIPYPIVEANIESMTVEGQRGADQNSSADAIINKNARTVTLYVNDGVDLSNLKITSLKITSGAELLADSAACKNYDKFPTTGFTSLDSIPLSSDTRMDFTNPVTFTLRTYQDYVWRVTVNQIIQRDIEVEGMTDYVIDANSRTVIVYVKDQELTNLNVTKMNLGGEYGTVSPDPTTIKDYSSPVKFNVRRSWEEYSYEWTVYVYPDNGETNSGSTDAFAMTTRATVNGKVQSGKTPVVEYCKQDEASWNTVPAANVSVSGNTFTATLTGLSPSTTYKYRISVDGTAGSELTFTTAAATPLENGSFDDWSSEVATNGTLWQPWSTSSFWDTGNRGATSIADSNSVPTSETCNGTGKAASLETKWIVMKLAAGNIFTGSYVRTDGTNGVLSFGREFSSFPSKLRINYKYTSATIDKIGEDALSYLKGQPDSCHIYIALTDWDQPLEIRTRPSERQLFDKNDSHVIAYAEYISGNSDSQYQQKDLVLDYRYTNRTPKYILVVASASKYGDYFTGGVGSKLLIDNFELVYE
ncbi:PCMD domain-containing protein [Phocaeicola barnesiae]|uniref:PCMD domain-containing protein n=1 Tax=Phocaeicola barnesiae TaxID=376804 RepID=UPI0025A380AF|nr:PCMD domain-containing protein [Phocaeicola barnesiae]MDM8308636.1 PCMD domain-containing protein [Phocaeicola barnesiae]